MKKTLIIFDVPATNGVIYTKEQFTRLRTYKNTSGFGDPETWEESLIDHFNNSGPKVMCGQIGHPADSKIALLKASHYVENIRIEENELVGDVEILDTSSGKLLTDLIEHIVFRPRCLGSITDDIAIIDELIAFDALNKEQDIWKIN